MSILARLKPTSVRGILLSVVMGLLLLVSAWQGLRAWWYHGYSRGTRTGIVRKFAYRGSPLCKYWSGELVVSGSSLMKPEIWYFTVDAARADDPVVKAIQQAEAGAQSATLQYREDKGKWWACAPTENYVVGVVKY